MTPDEYRLAGDLFERLCALPESERAAALDLACAGNPGLRSQVERLLEADRGVEANSFLNRRAIDDAARLLNQTAPDLPAPGTVFGNYRLGSQIGAGGMGVVFEGFDLRLERPVAIKILPMPLPGEDSQHVQRFRSESRATSLLSHPNIVSIFDAGLAHGCYYIAMERVEGRTLRQLIDAGGAGVPLSTALKYAVQIADGLAKAHQAGVVHRDLKLSNIMVTDDGRVKILDFGVAKLTQPSRSIRDAPRTEAGMIIGTAGYMSPEQAEAKPVDARSDIFSFGAVLYELVTGRAAFAGSTTVAVLSAVLRDEPRPTGVPPELERLIARCLRKDPARRFQNMEDVKAALLELNERPRFRTGHAYLAASVLAVAAVAVVALLATWRPAPEAEAPPPARVVPLTAFAGTEREPALSPDGNQVAMSWDGESGSGNFDIYVKMISGSAPLRLTSNPVADGFPAWSPDGLRIAFVRQSEPRAGVYVIPALGGPERRIAEAVNGKITWSPDGQWLVVSDYDGTGARREGSVSGFLVSVATGERRKLTISPSQAAFDTDFAFAPGGGSLAFVRWARTGAEVQLQTLTSSSTGPVASGAPVALTGDNSFVRGLAWTPDSSQVVFSSSRSGAWSLWQVAAAGGGRIRPLQLAGVAGDAFHPAISSRPHAQLVYEQAMQDVNIWGLDLAGSGAGARPVKLIASTRFDSNPQVSPDGKKLAFTSDRSGTFQIWLADLNGSNPAQLTSFSSPMTASPRWSPDGQQVAFDSLAGSNRDVYIARADGSGSPRRITEEPWEDARPCWSADSRWVYFMSTRSGSRQVWKAPADGGKSPAVQVTRHGGYECQESADGKLLYYTKDATELWSVPVGGGEEVSVIPEVRLGSWVAGRKGIYFIDHAGDKPGAPKPVKLYQPGSGQVKQVALLSERVESTQMNRPRRPGSAGRRLAISPDDRWLIWSQTDLAGADLMLADPIRW